MKMMKLAEMAKLTSLIREKTVSTFITDWKPHILHKSREKNKLMIYGFGDYTVGQFKKEKTYVVIIEKKGTCNFCKAVWKLPLCTFLLLLFFTVQCAITYCMKYFIK